MTQFDITNQKPKTKIEQLKKHIACNDMRSAILLAAKFPRLGEARDAILAAREAYLRPEFQRQLGRDPQTLIANGVAKLREQYNV